MILKTIPRSWRAGVALIVMLLAFWRGLETIQALLLPGEDTGVVVGILALFVGICAMIAFYYFQSVDDKRKGYNGMETLNRYHESEAHKHAKATPVFTSHGGSVEHSRKDGSHGAR